MAIQCRSPLIIAVFATALTFYGCSSRPEPRPPSDAELIEHFRNNQADFVALVSILNIHKQLVIFYTDGSYDKKAIRPEGASKYNALLDRCGLSGQEVTSYADQGSQFVEISLWHWKSRSLPDAKGIMKGSIYSTRKLGSPNDGEQVLQTHWPWGAKGSLKNTLDDAEQLGPGQRWYRPIEGDWYLYL
jgi:hypothetical protein